MPSAKVPVLTHKCLGKGILKLGLMVVKYVSAGCSFGTGGGKREVQRW